MYNANRLFINNYFATHNITRCSIPYRFSRLTALHFMIVTTTLQDVRCNLYFFKDILHSLEYNLPLKVWIY